MLVLRMRRGQAAFVIGCAAMLGVCGGAWDANGLETAASEPAGTRPALSVAAQLLRLAAEEAGKAPKGLFRVGELPVIAEGQGEVKDVEGLRMTAALIERTIDAEEDPFKPTIQRMMLPAVTGAFARAGNRDSYQAYVAKPGGASAEAYADAQDYPAMYKAVEAEEPAARRSTHYVNLAVRLASVDPKAAREAMRRAESLAPAGNTMASHMIIVGYVGMGDVDTALARAERVMGDETPHVYEVLADMFDEAGDHAAARRAKEKYIAAMQKSPQATQEANAFYVFTREAELGDMKAARAALDRLKAIADALPQRREDSAKSSYYQAAAEAAARLGEQKMAEQWSGLALDAVDMGDLRPMLKAQYDDELIAARGPWLATQGQPDAAAASVAGIADAGRRLIGLRKLIMAAAVVDDDRTAAAALAKLEDHEERLRQIPVVARVMVRADTARQKAGGAATEPAAAMRFEPMVWARSFVLPAERAAAARAAALELLRLERIAGKPAASRP